MKVKIGIVGTGSTVSIGAYHAHALAQIQDVEVKAVYNRTLERSKAFIAEHSLQTCRASRSYEELLDAVDAVIICTPSNMHTPFILKAIQAKRAILVEKPLVSTYSDCSLILGALEKEPVFTMVGYGLRFSNQVVALKRLVTEKMGRIYTLSISYGGLRLANPTIPFEWRMDKRASGFGSLQDFGSHILDITKYACNIHIKELTCTTQTHIPVRPVGYNQKSKVENDDSASITAVGDQGELCSLHMSRVGLDEFRIQVSGEGGLIKLSLEDDFLLYRPKQKDGGYDPLPQRIATQEQTFMTDFIIDQDRAFIAGIRGEHGEVCSFKEGCEIQNILDRAEQSSREKRTMYIDSWK